MSAIQIFPTADTLADGAANLFVLAAQEAIAERGRFTVALAGGKTPEATCARLARPAMAAQVEWDKVFVVFGDERFVPYDDERSNYGLARRTLLSSVPIPSANVFPIPTEMATPDEAARAYADILAGVFSRKPDDPPPVIDLILLGLGDDGHTASLFPGMPSLEVTEAWAVSTPPGTLPPPIERVTLTFPVLNAARQVVFLVGGAPKAAVVREILQGNSSREQYPAAGVQPTDGMLTWLLDEAAASAMTQR
jgi:6-phosphogluconolactonase